jgi:hypothetical protein
VFGFAADPFNDQQQGFIEVKLEEVGALKSDND